MSGYWINICHQWITTHYDNILCHNIRTSLHRSLVILVCARGIVCLVALNISAKLSNLQRGKIIHTLFLREKNSKS